MWPDISLTWDLRHRISLIIQGLHHFLLGLWSRFLTEILQPSNVSKDVGMTLENSRAILVFDMWINGKKTWHNKHKLQYYVKEISQNQIWPQACRTLAAFSMKVVGKLQYWKYKVCRVWKKQGYIRSYPYAEEIKEMLWITHYVLNVTTHGGPKAKDITGKKFKNYLKKAV